MSQWCTMPVALLRLASAYAGAGARNASPSVAYPPWHTSHPAVRRAAPAVSCAWRSRPRSLDQTHTCFHGRLFQESDRRHAGSISPTRDVWRRGGVVRQVAEERHAGTATELATLLGGEPVEWRADRLPRAHASSFPLRARSHSRHSRRAGRLAARSPVTHR